MLQAMLDTARASRKDADDETLLESAALWPDWKAGTAYAKEDLVNHAGQLYRAAQAHTAQAHQPPGSAGMLAVYTPVQAAKGDEILPWVYGEAVSAGDKRLYEGVVYEAIQSPGANIWTPPSAPAIWKKVS
jgi:hypothetical protein